MNKKLHLLLLAITISCTVFGQGGVGINTTNSSPDASAMLDVSATDKGVLIPRFALNDVNNAAPVTTPAKGLLIFNDGGTETEGFYYWDGAKWVPLGFGSGGGQIGSILSHGAATIPTGYLPCDGSAVSRATYADLFAIIGVTWGIGNGTTTFNLPDLRGRFLRGVDAGAGNDPDAATRTANNSGNAADNVGSYQTDTSLHIHEMIWNVNGGAMFSPVQIPTNGAWSGGLRSGNTDDQMRIRTNGVAENRPTNANINFIIQYMAVGGGSGGGAPQTLSFTSPNLTISGGNTVDLSALASSSGWSLTGNTATTNGTDFIGTTDNQALDIRTNNTLFFRATTKGQLEVLNTGESIFIGEGAGANDDLSSNQNVFIGQEAGNLTTTGDYNVATGYRTLYKNTTGTANIAIGYQTLYENTIGANNIALGRNTLINNTTGSQNTGIGQLALADNIGGNYNTSYGYESSLRNTSGDGNVAIGAGANRNNQAGNYNTIIGYDAGRGNGITVHSKSGNVFLGYRAGYYETTDNKLYIDNSSSATPLIYGDFATDFIRFNATVNVNGNYSLPTTDGTSGQVLTTDGAGNATWQAAAAGSAVPAGSIMPYVGTTAPAGWALCDGAQINRTTYATLYAVVGNAYGAGDGSTTFHLPDLRGNFLRGADNGAGNDPDAATRTAANAGGNTGDNVGSAQADEFKSHNHSLKFLDNTGAIVAAHASGTNGAFWNIQRVASNPVSGSDFRALNTGGNETRPKNISVNYIIKL